MGIGFSDGGEWGGGVGVGGSGRGDSCEEAETGVDGWSPRRGDKGAAAMRLGLVVWRQGEEEATACKVGFEGMDEVGEGIRMVAEVVVVV